MIPRYVPTARGATGTRLAAVLVVLVGAGAQPLRPMQTTPTCITACLKSNHGCRGCVQELVDRLSTPRELSLAFHKAHSSVPDPEVALRHHHFLDRPPWVAGSSNETHRPGDGKVMAEGKVHANCPAMRARSGAAGITLRMPYTARFYRSGLIEVDCHWISATHTHAVTVKHPVDSPWIRLPQSHMQIFTVGDSRADVWILNSGVYIDDAPYMSSPRAAPGDKGGSVGNKWLVLPVPHKRGAPTWRVEQGILSSFQRTSKNANIPLQLNFSALAPEDDYIEIVRSTPMMQYVPAVLPAVELHEEPMPKALADYLVLLSQMHGGGDIRVAKDADQGAYDVMRSYQLKENPGYIQSHVKRKRAPDGAAGAAAAATRASASPRQDL